MKLLRVDHALRRLQRALEVQARRVGGESHVEPAQVMRGVLTISDAGAWSGLRSTTLFAFKLSIRMRDFRNFRVIAP